MIRCQKDARRDDELTAVRRREIGRCCCFEGLLLYLILIIFVGRQAPAIEVRFPNNNVNVSFIAFCFSNNEKLKSKCITQVMRITSKHLPTFLVAAIIFVFSSVWEPRACGSLQKNAASISFAKVNSGPVVSPLLENILVCITFQWNLAKLVYLESMLTLIGGYETEVRILVVTDEAAKLGVVLSMWGYTGIKLWQTPREGDDGNLYSLVWAHKEAIEEEISRQDFTAVVYMEDDTRLSWASLTSWALDTEVLEPLNFTRCIYRTEISPDTGELMMLDWIEPVTVESHGKTLDMVLADPSKLDEVNRRIEHRYCGSIRDGLGPWHCKVHRHFLNPIRPFQGMWMATRKQLAAYMRSPYWKKESALQADIALPFGYPERSNSLNILVNVPIEYTSSCMVPYAHLNGSARHPVLVPEAEVYHMRNGYSSDPSFRNAKLKLEDALRP